MKFGHDAMLCMTEGEGFAAPQGIQERRGKRRARKRVRGWVREGLSSVCPSGELSVRMEVFYVCAVQHGDH